MPGERDRVRATAISTTDRRDRAGRQGRGRRDARDALARPATVTDVSGAFCFGFVEPLEERKTREGVVGAGFVPESLTGCALGAMASRGL